MSKKRNLLAATLVATVAMLMAARAQAQSPVAGYTSIAVPSNADVMVSAPLVDEAAASGTVAGFSGATIDVSGVTLDASYTTTPHYIRLTSGSNNGRWSTITAISDADTLTVEDATISTGLTNGDGFDILPHQTLGRTFPDWLEGTSFQASALTRRRTEVRMWSSGTTGKDQSAGEIYYYFTNATTRAWRLQAGGTTDRGNTIIPPNRAFIVRNTNNDPKPLTLYFLGGAPVGQNAQVVPTIASINDLYVGSGRPVPMTLGQLGLGGSAAFDARTAISDNVYDVVWMFDNTASGKDKSIANGYYYWTGSGGPAWRKVAGGTTDWTSSNVVEAASGFLIRKAVGSAANNTWAQNPPY